jgi:hypothetical protein
MAGSVETAQRRENFGVEVGGCVKLMAAKAIADRGCKV